MTTKFWLALGQSPYTNHIDFTDPDVLVIPVVALQTGGSRSQVSPGVYRQSRIRLYADKFGTVTGLSDQKEITFPAILYGDTMDDIYAKWKRINFYLDRAELAASPFPRGTGVVFVEQINDAATPTVWDVVSGVLSDVETNLPGIEMAIGILQLSVLPFSRGDLQTVAFGATRSNGTGASYYVPYPGGDAPGLFEIRLKDLSPAGHQVTWITVGRRWAPKMASSDFTPWYALGSSISLTTDWQAILPIVGSTTWDAFQWDAASWDALTYGSPIMNDPGSQQTGLFGVYAVVNDSSVVIGEPTGVSLTADQGRGGLSNGFVEVVLAPKDGGGNVSAVSPRYLLTIENPDQPGNVQDYEGFESGVWSTWSSPPITSIATGGSAALTIDAAGAIKGLLGAHFKVTGNSTGGSITSASAARLMPPMAGTGIQSIAFQIDPVSWGSWLSPTPIAAPASPPAIGIFPQIPIAAPGIPVVHVTGGSSGSLGPVTVGFTWTNPVGETTIGGLYTSFTSPISSTLVTIPAPPVGSGVTGANIYVAFGSNPLALWNTTPVIAGSYYIGPPPTSLQPPAINTTAATGNFTAGVTYNAGFTWLNAYGQTTISPLATFSYSTFGGPSFNAQMTIPAFPVGVTGAIMYVSRNDTPTVWVVYGVVSSPGPTNISQGHSEAWQAPTTNTTGIPSPGSWDETPRFTWGSLTICPSGTKNNFVLKVSGTQVGTAFTLTPGVVHQLGCNFRLIGTQATYSLIVDNNIIGSATDSIGPFILPISGLWEAVGAGLGGPYTEEWYLDEIYVYDALLQPGFQTTGSSATIRFIPDAFTSTIDLYYALHGTVSTDLIQWYKLSSVTSPYTLSSPIPPSAVPVTGPPSITSASSYSQLQARVGIGTSPVNFISKPIVRTQIANGSDELVRLGSVELPPGAKSDNRALDGWVLEILGKNNSQGGILTIRGVALFPEDEDGWTSITAKVPSLSTTGNIFHIGTNKYGRSYGQIFASDETTLLGYMDVTGAIGSMPGDQDFIVLTGRVDAKGRVSIDLTQTYQLGHQNTPRYHWEATTVGAP